MAEQAGKINIVGVNVSCLPLSDTLDRIGEYISGRGSHYVLASNVHTLMMSRGDPSYRRIHNAADICLPDGKPLVWAARILGGARIERICGRDLMSALCARSLAKGYSHYFLGGQEPVLRTLVSTLQNRYRGLRVAGYYSPPFRPVTAEEDARMIQAINESGADILWVGLGAPKQEKWIGEHAGRVRAPVMFAVGAAFDYLAGNIKPAPPWIQRAGLEWFVRLCSEPRRLWRRYILNNPKFVFLIACQALRLRKFPIPGE